MNYFQHSTQPGARVAGCPGAQVPKPALNPGRVSEQQPGPRPQPMGHQGGLHMRSQPGRAKAGARGGASGSTAYAHAHAHAHALRPPVAESANAIAQAARARLGLGLLLLAPPRVAARTGRCRVGRGLAAWPDGGGSL